MANLPNPVTRIEEFLSAAAGTPIKLPTPITRTEIFLAAVVAGIDVIKDDIRSLSKLKQWLGDTTTPLYEDATVDTIVISGEDVQVKNGDVARYNNNEFIFSEVGTWQPYNDELDVYTKDEADAKFADKIRTADALDDLNHDLSLAQNDITNLQNAVERMSYTVVLTQAEYDELPTAQKQNGTIYFTDDTNRIYKNGVEYNGAVDSAMSESSTNPVQNSVIKSYVDTAIAAITDYESEVFPNA